MSTLSAAPGRFLHVRVRYSQGVVKVFCTPNEILLDDFRKVANAFGGKIKAITFLPTLSEQEMRETVQNGATLVEARR